MALQTLGSVPAALSWLAQRGARGLATDSRRLEPGDAFIAWPGQAQDGRRHVYPALAAGAPACLVEADGAEAHGFDDARIAAMDNLKAVTGLLASAFYGAPSRRLPVVAVTGTNGKTSTAWWTAQALSALGRRCGLIGTLGIGAVPVGPAPAALQATGLTTPDPVVLQRAFKRFADDGFGACAIEASSIGLAEQRLSGTHIDVAVLTNFTQDHLDYHGSMDAYWRAKADLFGWPGLRAAVLNLDDPQGVALQRALADSAIDLWSYAVTGSAAATGPARLSGVRPRRGRRAAGAAAHRADRRLQPVEPAGGGRGAARAGHPAERCGAGLRRAGSGARPHAAGRPGGDVGRRAARRAGRLRAHARCARQGAARAAAAGRGARRCAVVRVRLRRQPRRGQAAADGRDRPAPGAAGGRHQRQPARRGAGRDPQPRPQVIEDRRAAIADAVSRAAANDVVLIAGKGHEAYQEIAGVRHPFDDVSVACAALQARARGAEQPS
jgi:UDP-N-acetylmuramoyl-L-alanyl-D-glutamate--2,6-diaminopimelate ligase